MNSFAETGAEGRAAQETMVTRARAAGVRHPHARGNEADVTFSKLAPAVAANPVLELFLLYLESIPDPHNLARLGALARTRWLPVAMVKAGRGERGKPAAVFPTGPPANEDATDQGVKNFDATCVRTVSQRLRARSLIEWWICSAGAARGPCDCRCENSATSTTHGA